MRIIGFPVLLEKMTEVQCHWKKHILNLPIIFPLISTLVPLSKALLKLSFLNLVSKLPKKCHLILGLFSVLIDIKHVILKGKILIHILVRDSVK